MTEQKTNGEHILEIAAMKYFKDENWDIELAAMMPPEFKEMLIDEINTRLMQFGVQVAENVRKQQG